MSPRVNEAQPFQMSQIVLESSEGGRILHTGSDDPKRRRPLTREEKKDLSLPKSEVMGYTKGSDVTPGQELDSHCATLFEELGLRMTCPDAELDDLLCAPAPALNQSTTEENLCHQRIARPREVFAFEVFDRGAERQGAIAPDFQAIIEYGQAHAATRVGVVAVTEGVDESFPESFEGKQRLISPFEQTWLHPTGNRKMSPKKKKRLLQELKTVALELALVEERCLVSPFKACHSELALREGWQEPAAERDHGGIEESSLHPKSEPIQDLGWLHP